MFRLMDPLLRPLSFFTFQALFYATLLLVGSGCGSASPNNKGGKPNNASNNNLEDTEMTDAQEQAEGGEQDLTKPPSPVVRLLDPDAGEPDRYPKGDTGEGTTPAQNFYFPEPPPANERPTNAELHEIDKAVMAWVSESLKYLFDPKVYQSDTPTNAFFAADEATFVTKVKENILGKLFPGELKIKDLEGKKKGLKVFSSKKKAAEESSGNNFYQSESQAFPEYDKYISSPFPKDFYLQSVRDNRPMSYTHCKATVPASYQTYMNTITQGVFWHILLRSHHSKHTFQLRNFIALKSLQDDKYVTSPVFGLAMQSLVEVYKKFFSPLVSYLGIADPTLYDYHDLLLLTNNGNRDLKTSALWDPNRTFDYREVTYDKGGTFDITATVHTTPADFPDTGRGCLNKWVVHHLQPALEVADYFFIRLFRQQVDGINATLIQKFSPDQTDINATIQDLTQSLAYRGMLKCVKNSKTFFQKVHLARLYDNPEYTKLNYKAKVRVDKGFSALKRHLLEEATPNTP